MLKDEEISERNGLLIDLIRELDLGIHIVELPHKPKLISNDYTKWLHGYVDNFHLKLMSAEFSKTVFFDIRLKPIENMDIETIREKVLEWMVTIEHKDIFTLRERKTKMFVVGFNHHNKILKTNPYPVFAYYDPIIYYSLDRALDTKRRFDNYDLILNQRRPERQLDNDFNNMTTKSF